MLGDPRAGHKGGQFGPEKQVDRPHGRSQGWTQGSEFCLREKRKNKNSRAIGKREAHSSRRNRANNKMGDHMAGHKGVKFSQKTTRATNK